MWVEGAHDFKFAALIRGIFWSRKGSFKMEGGVVDEFEVYIRGLVVLAVCTNEKRSDQRAS